jgi:transcriptional regulator with XRE-family HTH domain
MIDRIKKLLETEQLSPSQFADEIKLQRSSLSHVLSGRNKPSLDFVMKIKQRFANVSLDWLIFGAGNMFSGKDNIVSRVVESSSGKDNSDSQPMFNFDSQRKPEPGNLIKDEDAEVYNVSSTKVVSGSGSASKVIIFYNNGTFEEFIKG